MERFHPKAIKVEYLNWYIPCLHAFQKRVHSLLIIVCSEASAEPQTKTPTWDFAGPASQDRILLEDFLRSRAMNDIPILRLSIPYII